MYALSKDNGGGRKQFNNIKPEIKFILEIEKNIKYNYLCMIIRKPEYNNFERTIYWNQIAPEK